MMFLGTRLLLQAARTIRLQNEILDDQNERIELLEHEKMCVELAYMRISRDLLEQFLIALDCPENHDEVRDKVFASLGFYRDEIAVREEHVR